MKCPHCKAEINPVLKTELSISLPPTGKDYEWVDNWVDIKCEHCSKNLTAIFRYWLNNKKIECKSVSRRKPDADPWCSAWQMSFSPDGNYLIIKSRSNNIWMIKNENEKWIIKSKKCSYPAAWFPDNKRYINEDLEIVDIKTLNILEKIDYHMTEFRAVKIFNNDYVILEWETILEKKSEVSIYSLKTKKWQNYKLPYTSGISMSGKIWFEPKGHRMLRVHPLSHGNPMYIIELYKINPEDPKSVKKMASFQEKWLEVKHIFWDTDGSILLGYAHYDVGTKFCESMPFGILRVDGNTLKEINRQHTLPEKVSSIKIIKKRFEMDYNCDFDGLYSFNYDKKNILLVTDALYILNEMEEKFVFSGKIQEDIFPETDREIHEHYVTAYSPEKNMLAVSFRNELYLYNVQNNKFAALGSKLINIK